MNGHENTKKFWAGEVVRGNLIYPDEHVIRFVKKNYRPNSVILDFGCGAGRHVLTLAKEGYECIAMDYTSEALELVRGKMLAEKLNFQLVQNNELDVPLLENSVDAIVAHGSLFYHNMADTLILLSNLCKVLKNGGKIWANWRTKQDSFFQEGIEIEIGDSLYRLGERTSVESVTYFFCEEEELVELYKKAGFSVESVDLYEYTENNKKTKCSWYHVIAYK